MFNTVDLSSDTATQPTKEMKQAMIAADLGDEQKGERSYDIKTSRDNRSFTWFRKSIIFSFCNNGKSNRNKTIM